MASEIKVDTISEKTSAGGVTIDSVKLKDGGIVISDAANIGSASDTDALAISSGGVVTFSQNPVFPDGGVAVADLDIDGATDIGAAVVDADLFIVNDGAGGTNRKVTASRLKTYAGTTINNATANEIVTIASTTTELDAEAKLLFDPPKLTIGNATAEDTSIVFDGNAQDFYIGLDDSADDLVIGLGATVGTTPAISITEDQDVLFAKTFTTTDDEGWIIGSGSDFWFGAAAGEDNIAAYKGGTQGQDATEGYIWLNPNGNIQIVGQENSDATLAMYGDQADDAGEQWTLQAHKNTASLFLNVDTNVATQNFAFTEAGSGDADATWDDNVWDYAELFPWKTPLLNDGDINALWGMTVVLDGDFVRLAEAGEEDLVMGVVRPKGSTGTHGDGLGWHGRRKKDTPWNVDEYEDYTQVNWQEFLPNGNASYRHAYNKDEIPAYRLKDEACRDKNWHTKEENFYKDKDGNKIPVVVPSTAEEKVAANYIERTTHKQTGKILKRRIYADDYDETQPYIRRKDRPREWVLIGLLGQVPIRDTAVIPTTWTKMKNLASGIDKYFIK